MGSSKKLKVIFQHFLGETEYACMCLGFSPGFVLGLFSFLFRTLSQMLCPLIMVMKCNTAATTAVRVLGAQQGSDCWAAHTES